MGIGTIRTDQTPYVPPMDRTAPTMLGGSDPDVVLAADPAPPASDASSGESNDDVQIAQQRPAASGRTPAPGPISTPASADHGYGVIPQAVIERGLTPLQRSISRNQALMDYARRPVPRAIADPLPDDWERTKPSEVVDELRRAAQRNNVPLLPFARSMYQEGKFLEPDKIDPKHPIIMQSTNPDQPLGWAQMTTRTLDDLKRLARERGDWTRAKELAGYSLANRAQAFDAAAERLAYLQRLTGSWPGAFAAYNMGPTYVHRWLSGDTTLQDPKSLPNDKWNEVANYVSNAFRGQPELGQTSDMYGTENANTGFRIAAPVPGDPKRADFWRMPEDPLINP